MDIVERVSSTGVKDQRLGIVKPTGEYDLHHRALSPLLDALVDEARKVANGQGFLTRWLGTIQTDIGKQLDPELMEKLRGAAYPQYEYSVLAFMALSSIEQLLRAFAHHAGLFEGQERFTPNRIARIVTALGGGTDVSDAILNVYDGGRGNLRNRILHGAQLQIARSQ